MKKSNWQEQYERDCGNSYCDEWRRLVESKWSKMRLFTTNSNSLGIGNVLFIGWQFSARKWALFMGWQNYRTLETKIDWNNLVRIWKLSTGGSPLSPKVRGCFAQWHMILCVSETSTEKSEKLAWVLIGKSGEGKPLLGSLGEERQRLPKKRRWVTIRGE